MGGFSHPVAATDDISDKELRVGEAAVGGSSARRRRGERGGHHRASAGATTRDYRELLNLPVCAD